MPSSDATSCVTVIPRRSSENLATAKSTNILEIREQEQRERDARRARAIKSADKTKAIIEEGFRTGYDNGFKDGQAKGEAEGYKVGMAKAELEAKEQLAKTLRAKSEELDLLIQAFKDEIRTLKSTDMSDALTTLATTTGKKLALRDISADHDTIVNLLTDFMHNSDLLNGRVTVRLNPEDAAFVQDHLASQLAYYDWQILPDDEITRGGCKIFSARGDIDATLEKRLAFIDHKHQQSMESNDE